MDSLNRKRTTRLIESAKKYRSVGASCFRSSTPVPGDESVGNNIPSSPKISRHSTPSSEHRRLYATKSRGLTVVQSGLVLGPSNRTGLADRSAESFYITSLRDSTSISYTLIRSFSQILPKHSGCEAINCFRFAGKAALTRKTSSGQCPDALPVSLGAPSLSLTTKSQSVPLFGICPLTQSSRSPSSETCSWMSEYMNFLTGERQEVAP